VGNTCAWCNIDEILRCAGQKADPCLLDTRTGTRRNVVIATAPEALWAWLAQLRQQYPDARVGLCLEHPAGYLVAFFEANAWLTLHPINPLTLQKYREAFVISRAKDDTQDAEYLADLLLHHHVQLPVWAPEDSATRGATTRRASPRGDGRTHGFDQLPPGLR